MVTSSYCLCAPFSARNGEFLWNHSIISATLHSADSEWRVIVFTFLWFFYITNAFVKDFQEKILSVVPRTWTHNVGVYRPSALTILPPQRTALSTLYSGTKLWIAHTMLFFHTKAIHKGDPSRVEYNFSWSLFVY